MITSSGNKKGVINIIRLPLVDLANWNTWAMTTSLYFASSGECWRVNLTNP